MTGDAATLARVRKRTPPPPTVHDHLTRATGAIAELDGDRARAGELAAFPDPTEAERELAEPDVDPDLEDL